MKKMNWKIIAEFVGIAALVGSLIFVGLQLRQELYVAQAESFSANNAAAIELARLISENRDVWVRGLNGEELTNLEKITFLAIAEALYKQNSNKARIAYRIDTLAADRTARWYAFFVYQYPGLRELVEYRNAESAMIGRAFRVPLGPSFLDDVTKFLAELDLASPAVPERNYIPRL